MSLFLPYKDMWDMPMNPALAAEGEKTIPHWFVNICYVIIWPLIFGLFRFKVVNRERLFALGQKVGVFTVANHTCYLDPVFAFFAARPKIWMRFMAKDDMFDNFFGLGGQAMSRAGAFPIKRDSADRTNIKRGAKILKRGEALLIFPEGTRRGKTDYNITLHGGAAFIAHMANAPILPMGFNGLDRVYAKYYLRFPKITLTVGEPLRVSDFDMFPKAERLEACTWFFMREVHALSAGVAPEEIDMDALYPGSKNYAAELDGFVPASRARWREIGPDAYVTKAAEE